MKRWLLALLIGALAAFAGGLFVGAFVLDDEPDTSPTTSPSPTPTPSPSPSPTPTPSPSPTTSASPSPAPSEECSSSEVDSLTLTTQGALPGAVQQTRARIFAAARDCAFETLDEIARERGGRFSYSFGADDSPVPGEFAEYLRSVDESEDAMRVLAQILSLPSCQQDYRKAKGQRLTAYAWPSIYCAENPPAAQWEQLDGIYSRRLIRQNMRLGHYLLHRVGITEDGDWVFFIAGD